MALNVVVAPSVTGAVYSVPRVALGVLPSVVYRTLASLGLASMVTGWGPLYAPDPGSSHTGESCGARIVYSAEDTSLSVIPLAYAIALIVVEELTGTGPVYCVPEAGVGMLPSVV